MTDLIMKDNIKIEDLIYEVRGKQVMLDSDLAKIYEYTTFNLNKAVTRNIDKFPFEYMFVLTNDEYKNLIFQNGISNNNHGGRRTLPRVFAEKGILMLATILKSEKAVSVSIDIINTFVLMKRYITFGNYNKRISTVETKLLEHDTKIDLILDKLDNTVNNHIFFEGQIYDAYSLMMDILGKAREEIIIIDNYAGKKLFDLLRDIKVGIKIYSKNFDLELIKKYNSQYSNISTFIHNGFHDRFIILDKSILYHCGSSFKDLGIKCFAINKVDHPFLLENILSYLKNQKSFRKVN